MDWKTQLGDMLERYSNANPNNAPASVHDDFDHLSRTASPDVLADGLAAAFRSDQTPPFASMLAQMFGRSSPSQRAAMLNSLIAVVGPALMTHLMASRSGHAMPSSGSEQVTPEMAQQIPPEVVEEVAKTAEQRDPSIIDRMSDFYAQQPAIVKTLGTAALTLALARMAQRQSGQRG